MKRLRCPNKACPHVQKARAGHIIRHGFYKTKWGKRRRYRCGICGTTFCSNAGTPYYRLQHLRTTLDDVAVLRVEGLNKSAIARVKGIGWNTVARWLEKAADSCRRFNDRKTKRFTVAELQADEIRTLVGGKAQPIWVFAVIEVWSRLWPSTVVGRRSYRNTLALFRDISNRMNIKHVPLIDHLELLRCHYNFIRPHRALKFGRKVRTPAMQAGLVSKRLSFREVFVAEPGRILFVIVFINVRSDASRLCEQSLAA